MRFSGIGEVIGFEIGGDRSFGFFACLDFLTWIFVVNFSGLLDLYNHLGLDYERA